MFGFETEMFEFEIECLILIKFVNGTFEFMKLNI